MKINSIQSYNPNFNARSYRVYPKHTDIQTDNNPNLGKNPYCVITFYDDFFHRNQIIEKKMREEDGVYHSEVRGSIPSFLYHIYYKDTGLRDPADGTDYYVKNAPSYRDYIPTLRKHFNQPLVHAIKPGKAVGKLIFKDEFTDNDSKEIKEPSIIVTNKFFVHAGNPNIIGLLFTENDMGALEHLSTNYRQGTKVCATVFDKEKLSKLKSLNGKNVELEVKDDVLNASVTRKKGTPMVFLPVKIPPMKFSDKVLTPKEYTPDTVGAKALNLAKLERLAATGKIDVKVPRSVALPWGYIDKLYKDNPDILRDPDTNKPIVTEYNDKYCREDMMLLMKTLKQNGIYPNAINSPYVMVRSSFNGEDLANYSAAGIYESTNAKVDSQHLYQAITFVADSNNSAKAMESRAVYHINDDAIKPCVIIQNKVDPDYKFTLYTDDNYGKVKIDMYSGANSKYSQPHVFTYDKKTKKLSYDSIQMPNAAFVDLDENLQISGFEPIQNNLSGNKKLFNTVQKLVDNALIIEKEFGHPQDIEGGILGNDIYLWQTRNIVNNGQ
ncbi:hypothetical protein IJ182_02725 [bacterium]|nr:hypothetical protein [bacterium]